MVFFGFHQRQRTKSAPAPPQIRTLTLQLPPSPNRIHHNKSLCNLAANQPYPRSPSSPVPPSPISVKRKPVPAFLYEEETRHETDGRQRQASAPACSSSVLQSNPKTPPRDGALSPLTTNEMSQLEMFLSRHQSGLCARRHRKRSDGQLDRGTFGVSRNDPFLENEGGLKSGWDDDSEDGLGFDDEDDANTVVEPLTLPESHDADQYDILEAYLNPEDNEVKHSGEHPKRDTFGLEHPPHTADSPFLQVPILDAPSTPERSRSYLLGQSGTPGRSPAPASPYYSPIPSASSSASSSTASFASTMSRPPSYTSAPQSPSLIIEGYVQGTLTSPERPKSRLASEYDPWAEEDTDAEQLLQAGLSRIRGISSVYSNQSTTSYASSTRNTLVGSPEPVLPCDATPSWNHQAVLAQRQEPLKSLVSRRLSKSTKARTASSPALRPSQDLQLCPHPYPRPSPSMGQMSITHRIMEYDVLERACELPGEYDSGRIAQAEGFSSNTSSFLATTRNLPPRFSSLSKSTDSFSVRSADSPQRRMYIPHTTFTSLDVGSTDSIPSSPLHSMPSSKERRDYAASSDTTPSHRFNQNHRFPAIKGSSSPKQGKFRRDGFKLLSFIRPSFGISLGYK